MIAHLWQRNGVYYAVWQEGGRQRQRSLKTSDERQAMVRLNDHNRRLSAGKITPIRSHVVPLSDLHRRVIEHMETMAARGNIRPSTIVLTDAALGKAMAAWGQNKNAMAVSHRDVSALVDYLVSKKISNPTINKHLRHLKAAWRLAQEWGMAAPVKWPRPLREPDTIRYCQSHELSALLAAITDPEFADICMLSAYSGLRSGEILRLTAADIDNPPGMLRVSDDQKNRTESRIPINKNMRAVFDRRMSGLSGRLGRIFSVKSVTEVSHKFRAAAVKAKLPQFRFHDLRHTFGAHLVMAGTDIRIVQQLMRHRSITSTMVYTRLYPQALAAHSESLDYKLAL